MTYNDARQEFNELFGNPGTWPFSLNTENIPVEAYRVFNTKEAADTFIQGEEDLGEILYEVYPGAVISVINDSSVENNGLYHVVNNPNYSEESDNRRYLLNKYYDANTVDSLISEATMHFTNVGDEGTDESKLVYFTGVDRSSSHNDSNMYIVPDIAYDKDGTLFTSSTVHSSDVRLKDHIEDLDVDLGKVGEIDKIRFTWKDTMNGKRQIGTTAQSLETTFPDLVYTNPETGYKAVNYDGLSVIALAAIDKLYARVRELENEVRKLKAGNTEQ